MPAGQVPGLMHWNRRTHYSLGESVSTFLSNLYVLCGKILYGNRRSPGMDFGFELTAEFLDKVSGGPGGAIG